MKKIVIAICFAMALLVASLLNKTAFAMGECGLSCCVAGAASSGITLAPNLGISIQYENSQMKTLKNGKSEVSPGEVLNAVSSTWPAMPMTTKRFSIPVDMTMQKYTLTVARPVTERLRLLAIVPYVENDMKMRTITRSTMGMDMTMDMTMDTVRGLGDATLMALYDAYTDSFVRSGQRLTLGLGIKTPTGRNDEKTQNGSLVHAMMQPGSGSWDALFMANYMKAYYPLVLQANLLYHLTTEGDMGYEFGDQTSLDLIARYQALDYVNLGLELNGIYAGKDTDHDGRYSRPETSLVDNTDNTGIKSVFVSPGIQVKIPGTGGNFGLKLQIPIYQSANGTQQVLDMRTLASLAWNF